jgi:hypothetical protein
MAQDPAQKNYEDLTSPRLKSNKVGLGTLHKDLQDIRQELQGNDSLNTGPVNPLLNLVPANQELPRDAENPGILEQLKASAIMGIKEALGVDTTEEERLQTTPELKNQRIYDEFIQQVKQQQDLLLDATKEQTDIFKKLEDTILQLKTANKEDSTKLRKSIDNLAKQLKATPETSAKQKIARLIPEQQIRSQTAKTETRIKSPVVSTRSSAVPALLMAPPVASNSPLYEDAGLISSESEGDKVQTGERDMDMATILGFLGNMMSGGDGGGILPIGPMGNKPGKTPGKTTPRGAKTSAPKPPVRNVTDKRGVTRQIGPSGQFLPKGSAAAQSPTLNMPKLGTGKVGGGVMAAASLFSIPTLWRYARSDDTFKESMNVSGDIPLKETYGDMWNVTKAAVTGSDIPAYKDPLKTTAPAPATAKPDNQILQQSMQNKDLIQQSQSQPAAPVIINNQQTVGNNTPPAYIAPSLEVRPKESALDRYINRQTVY